MNEMCNDTLVQMKVIEARKKLNILKQNIKNINDECCNFVPTDYIQGLYNGYETALALLECREVELRQVGDLDLNDIFHIDNQNNVICGSVDNE